MIMFALYVITTFVTFVAGSVWGRRSEKAAKEIAQTELTKLTDAILAARNRVETAAKRV